MSVVGRIRSPLFLLGGYGFYLIIALYLMAPTTPIISAVVNSGTFRVMLCVRIRRYHYWSVYFGQGEGHPAL